MTSVDHAEFTVVRMFEAPRDEVFRAFSTPDGKRAWFGMEPGFAEERRTFEFEVGKGDLLEGTWPDGTRTTFESRYEDIVPGRRIVFTYHVSTNGRKVSISLFTLDFEPSGSGTRLAATEQVVLLDGFKDPGGHMRQEGIIGQLGLLAKSLSA